MKLLELIEPKITHHTTNLSPRKYDKMIRNMGADDPYSREDNDPPKARNDKVKVLGAGAFGSAIQNQSSPTVMKVSRGTNNLDNDGYYQYVSRLGKHDAMASNPYFPKIYKIKVFANSGEQPADNQHKRMKYFYFVEMERLDPLSKSSEEEILYFYEKIAGRRPSERAIAQLHRDKNLFVNDYLNEVIGHLAQRVPANVDDPLMRQALLFIKNIIRDGHGRFDLHYGNIMVRRTSVGPQLVFSDPMADN